MFAKSSIFEKTYEDYLNQIARVDLGSVEEKLGVKVEGSEVIIPVFGIPHRVSERGITDRSGQRPSFEMCVILSKYLLLCPDGYPEDRTWVSYRDLKDSGPLTVYFSNDVEGAISQYYGGRVDDLRMSSELLGGHPPDTEFPYDVSSKFSLLPRIPVLMLYNDTDDEFDARCSLLFERRAEEYLDAECLAMAGRLLFDSLKGAALQVK